MFITFEGGEGSGKTLQIQKLKSHLESLGHEVIATREPGGLPIAEKIRQVLIGQDVDDMDGMTEVLLYAAARREHFIHVIKPALDAGKIVLSDRFYDSSVVYQGLVKWALSWKEIEAINLKVTGGLPPDITLYLDIEPEKALERIKQNSEREVNRFDKANLDFHHQVRYGYLAWQTCNQERIVRINADQTPEEVSQDCIALVTELLR